MLYELILTLLLYLGVETFIKYREEEKLSYLLIGGVFLFAFFNLWLFLYGKVLREFYTIFNIGLNALPILVLVLLYYIEAQRRKTLSYFSRYVDESLVKELLKKPIKMGGEKREALIIFTDVRGFTAMSERLEPEDVVEILNGHFHIITDKAKKWKGTLLKFIGDAAMIAFNIPYSQEDFEERAFAMSKEIIEGLKVYAKEIKGKYGLDFAIGIGMNEGELVVGNIGSEMQMDYTVIGDVVNTASRLNGVAKAWEIVMPLALAKKLEKKGKLKISRTHIKKVEVKGKSKPLEVYVWR